MANRIDQLQSLLERDPDDAFCLYGLAIEYRKAGDLATAVSFFDRAITADPDSLYAYYHKARCLQEEDAIDEARATLRAGRARAQKAGDAHAAGEIEAFLDELE